MVAVAAEAALLTSLLHALPLREVSVVSVLESCLDSARMVADP